MDSIIEELKQLVTFKETTGAGDIVIIATAEPRMFLYALVTAIEPDAQRKKSWWNVAMQVLTLPPARVVWTLREPQFTGQEIFTFDGAEHFMKAVRFENGESRSSAGGSGGETKDDPRSRLRVVK